MRSHVSVQSTLPKDGYAGTLIGRVWLPGDKGGPAVAAFRDDGVFDLTGIAPTVAELINFPERLEMARRQNVPKIGDLAEILENSLPGKVHNDRLRLLPPCDLQAVKAAGVTFVKSMLERVIEERARGDAGLQETLRGKIEGLIGGSLRSVEPGSKEAETLKQHLIDEEMWSQYLEVGIGPDAEIFTKAQPMSSVGHASEIGLHPKSTWNNPEPEIVLVVDYAGRIVGATLGNDVNLRDFEGRSALLLSKAKDNNASCAIGPFIRLFDETYGIDDVRKAEVELEVIGRDGFALDGLSSMSEISRDPEALVGAMMGDAHQYPDGALLFCGTMFAPTKDRDTKGEGFTHKRGDVVIIRNERLGTLANTVETSDRIRPWDFGAIALMHSLTARGHLNAV